MFFFQGDSGGEFSRNSAPHERGGQSGGGGLAFASSLLDTPARKDSPEFPTNSFLLRGARGSSKFVPRGKFWVVGLWVEVRGLFV